MAEESAKLRIPYIAAAQAQKHVTHNEAMTLLDTLVQLSVLDKDLTAPPGSPTEGDTYIVAGGGGTATGAWTGWEKRVARHIDGEWRSYLPGEGDGAGWLAWVLDEDAMYRFDGTAWELAGIEGPEGPEGPAGADGQSFQPDAVVAAIAGRDTYDDEAAAFSVLVASDTTNGDQPTLYFKLSASSADWSDGITWALGGGGTLADGDKGDVVVSGGGATWTIDSDAVTFSKMQDIASDRLIGRDTASSGDAEEITIGGGIEFTGSGGIRRSALTGDVTASAGSNTLTIANNAVTNGKLDDMTSWSFKVRNFGTTGNPTDAALGDLTEESAPASGDFLIGFLASGEIRIFDIGNLPGGSGGGIFLQSARDSYGTNTNITAVIPADDTIPQSSEGTEILSIAFTPVSATSTLRIRGSGFGACNASSGTAFAVFQSGSANAICAGMWGGAALSSNFHAFTFETEFTPGSTDPVTISVRVGPASAGTLRLNGNVANHMFGSAAAASLTVDEIEA